MLVNKAKSIKRIVRLWSYWGDLDQAFYIAGYEDAVTEDEAGLDRCIRKLICKEHHRAYVAGKTGQWLEDHNGKLHRHGINGYREV